MLLLICLASNFKTNLLFLRILVTFLTAAIITIGENSDSLLEKFWNNRFCEFLGTISYSLYLYHWAIATFISYFYLPICQLQNLAIYFGFSALLASLSTFLIEQPVQKYVKSRIKDLNISLIIGSILTLPCLFALTTFAPMRQFSSQYFLKVAERTNSANFTNVRVFDLNFQNWQKFETDLAEHEKCLRRNGTIENPCYYGNESARLKTVIWSDSHASRVHFLHRFTKRVTRGQEIVSIFKKPFLLAKLLTSNSCKMCRILKLACF